MKVGNRVRCISGNSIVTKGDYYTINEDDGDLIGLKEIPGWKHSVNMFELVEFSVGDKVVCIDNVSSGKTALTLGRIYTIIDFLGDEPIVINDLGEKISYMPKRFKLATDDVVYATRQIEIAAPIVETKKIDFRYYGFSSLEEMRRTLGI